MLTMHVTQDLQCTMVEKRGVFICCLLKGELVLAYFLSFHLLTPYLFLLFFSFAILPTMATSILSLPNEVLLSIADHLCLGDLYECSRVCRPWYHVYRQALYRSMDIHDTYSVESLVSSSIPLHAIRHLHLANQVDVNSTTMSAFPWFRLQSLHTTQLVFESIPIQSTCLSSLTLSNVQFDKVAPYFKYLNGLEKLSLSMTSGELLISDIDHIQQACPYLVTLELQGDVLSSSNLIRQISSSEKQTQLASRLTSLMIRFKRFDYDAAVPWFTYISHTFKALNHLTLEGKSVIVDLREQLQQYMSEHVDAAFVACVGVTRLPLKSVRLLYLGYLLRPDLYLLLVHSVPKVDMQGIELQLCKEGWLEHMLTSMHSSVQNLSMTMVYPRALCNCSVLHSCQALRELTIGRTSGFCSSRGHWQLPLDDILAHATSLESLTLCQVTVTDADHNKDNNGSSYTIHHRLRRLVLKGVVVSNHVFQRVAQSCPNMDWLEMNQCKWMDSRQQQQGQIPKPGRIHLPQHHFRMIDISKSGHLYNLKGYQLLLLNERQWLKSTSKDDQSREVTTWQQLREAQKIPRRCELVDPYTVTSLEIWHHGHLELSCASVQHFYFNGSRVPIPLLF